MRRITPYMRVHTDEQLPKFLIRQKRKSASADHFMLMEIGLPWNFDLQQECGSSFGHGGEGEQVKMLQDMLADQCQLQAKQLKSRLGFAFLQLCRLQHFQTCRQHYGTMGNTPHLEPNPKLRAHSSTALQSAPIFGENLGPLCKVGGRGRPVHGCEMLDGSVCRSFGKELISVNRTTWLLP